MRTFPLRRTSIALSFVAFICIAWQAKAPIPGLVTSLNSNAQSPPKSSGITSNRAQVLCDLVPEIKVTPMKEDRGEDIIYTALIAAGDAVVPCLIEKVADTTPMADPRGVPTYPDTITTVGDVAYFVMGDITGLDFIAPLPPKVKEAYRDEGVFAYFDYVEKVENRLQLQHNLRDWYSKAKAPAPGSVPGLNSNAQSPPPSSGTTSNQAQGLCDLVPKIKVIPTRGDKGRDPIYDALIVAGDAVVPCLIDKIADTTPMADPRETPSYDTRTPSYNTTVGDIAFFVMEDVTGMDFLAPLPSEVREAYRDKGVDAYFDYVEKTENRLKLQQNLRDLYTKLGGFPTPPTAAQAALRKSE